MGEDDFSLEAAILATDLEFLRLNLVDLKLGVFSSDQFDRVGQLFLVRHGG